MKAIFAAVIASIFGVAPATAASAAPTTVTHPQWSRNAVIYEVNVRQYTPEGTFKAFARHLPRLRDLGVDILWLMPIHPISEEGRKGTLGSYYAVRDYYGVNPEFGTMDDMCALVDSIHAYGMHVIIDWVPNHTGCDNVWVKTHPEYYARNAKGEMYGPYDWTDVYKLDYKNPATRRAMTDAMAFWLKKAGIDGFRCDVAMEVPTDYWNEARIELQRIRPDLFMLAEASNADLTEHAFDMAYNWPMKDLFNAVAATAGEYTFVAPDESAPRKYEEKHAIDIASLAIGQREQFPADAYLMNMVTNHDLNSWEGTEFQRYGRLTSAMAVLSFTLPGMPLIYTGQEAGMDRALQFFEKDTAPDFESNPDMTSFYKTLAALKHSRRELRAGAAPGFEPIDTGNKDVLMFRRTNADDVRSYTLVCVNLGKDDVLVPLPPDIAYSQNIIGANISATDFSEVQGREPAPSSIGVTFAPGGYIIAPVDR